MGQVNNRIQVLRPAEGSEEPSAGAIKRALHELSRTTSGSAHSDRGAILREAHDLLRLLAYRNGIDPDAAVQQRRVKLQSQRERMVLASITASDPTLT